MRTKTKLPYLLFILTLNLFGCNTSNVQKAPEPPAARDAIVRWLNTGQVIPERMISAETRRISERLGITYSGVSRKELIQYDIDSAILREIRQKTATFLLTESRLTDGFSTIEIIIPEREDTLTFYFQQGKLVTPVEYYSRNWQRELTRYFDYRISNPANFNRRAAKEMRDFTEKMLDFLEIDEAGRQRLEQEKIIYFLCDSPEEIEQVSGFNTRGIYLLGIDAIISQFNAHFHEVAHLLINYKLQQLPLYTHPFLQEGFAAAVGGRGDKSTEVILNLGRFLQKSEFLPYKELLNAQQFTGQDASLSYPASAFYNRFLLDEWRLPRYLDFYRKHSRTTPVRNAIPASQLPADSIFAAYLDAHADLNPISFPEVFPETAAVVEADWGSIWEKGDTYFFDLRGNIRLTPPDPPKTFVSKEFREIFPDVRYSGERYVLSVSENEVKLFDFYTAKLVAIYAKGLSLAQQTIQQPDGNFRFAIRKNAFSVPLTTMRIAQ